MARKLLMSWNESKRRWEKMYQGTRYRVSCEHLNAPLPTKEASYRLANEWWKKKQAELGYDPRKEFMTRYQRADLNETIDKGRAAERMLAALLVNDLNPAVSEKHYPTERLAEVDNVLEGKPTDAEMTLAHQTDRFLMHEQARGKKPNTYADIRYFLCKLRDECPHLPPHLDVRKLDGKTVSDLYRWLRRETEMAAHSQHKAFNHFRRFVRFLWGQNLCELPRNLDDRTFTFDDKAKRVKTYEVEQVRQMLSTIPKRHKLYAMLAMNCGMLRALIITPA